jgi:hypothetical protein
LTALRSSLAYSSALNEFLGDEKLVVRLMSLISPDVVSNVQRQALELLIVIVNFKGWQVVHNAALECCAMVGKQVC